MRGFLLILLKWRNYLDETPVHYRKTTEAGAVFFLNGSLKHIHSKK